jgi:putative transposase
MIDRTHKLTVNRQCRLLNLARSTAYYKIASVSDEDLTLMQRIAIIHSSHPTMGQRMIRYTLVNSGIPIGRKRVRTLMNRMGIRAHYKRPRTTKPNPEHKIYPYLLRNICIDKVNQVWATDITYIPMKYGFIYLVAVLDWHSRRVLSWRLSNTLHDEFCVAALNEAILKYGTPQIFNTDQGSQFTGDAFINVLKKHKIEISMDGRGSWVDNVIVERFWRSVKYEEVYQRAYTDMRDARFHIGQYIDFYNSGRPHRAHGGKSPDSIYFAGHETCGVA